MLTLKNKTTNKVLTDYCNFGIVVENVSVVQVAFFVFTHRSSRTTVLQSHQANCGAAGDETPQGPKRPFLQREESLTWIWRQICKLHIQFTYSAYVSNEILVEFFFVCCVLIVKRITHGDFACFFCVLTGLIIVSNCNTHHCELYVSQAGRPSLCKPRQTLGFIYLWGGFYPLLVLLCCLCCGLLTKRLRCRCWLLLLNLENPVFLVVWNNMQNNLKLHSFLSLGQFNYMIYSCSPFFVRWEKWRSHQKKKKLTKRKIMLKRWLATRDDTLLERTQLATDVGAIRK